MEDRELILLSLENSANYKNLVDKYVAPLSRYLYRLGCYEKEDAEDLLQEIFLKVYVNLNNYDSEYSFSSWIYRIAHNAAMTHFYKKNKQKKVFLDNMLEVSEFPADVNLMQELDAEYDKKLLMQEIEHLDENYKDVIILKYIENKNYADMSYILQKPEGTIATLLNRAKKELKKRLLNKINKYE